MTALLPPLVLTAGLTPLPALPRTGTLTAGVLQHGEGGALLVTQPGPHPAPPQDDGDSPGPGQPGHTPGEAGAGGAASATAVNLKTSSVEREEDRLELLTWT